MKSFFLMDKKESTLSSSASLDMLSSEVMVQKITKNCLHMVTGFLMVHCYCYGGGEEAKSYCFLRYTVPGIGEMGLGVC